MKPVFQILIMGIFSSLFSCSHKQNKSPGKLYDITSRTDTSEGFSDIFLSITSDIKTDTSHIYTGQGLYKQKKVGLKFEVPLNIPAGITSTGEINAKSGFVRYGVKFIPNGKESDNLLFALAQLYNEPPKNAFTKKILTPTLFSLNQQNADLDKTGYYKFKLFFNDDSEDENSYAELFFNINTEEEIIELHEKDLDYRKPLLKVFAGE